MDGTPFGRYRLLEKVGQGGMGQVWRAYDTETTRVVAIKLLPEHLFNDPTYQERFRREARIAAGLTDPHVVPIHQFGEIDGRLYVDMRLIDGADLGALIARRPLPAPRAVAIIEQVASALTEAHQAGLVHRDVKPSNILVAKGDFAYLIDFGIAQDTDGGGLTATGLFVGTLAYMAPERFNRGVADASWDTYALACVLYEALTGLPPYPGNNMEQLQVGHLLCPPPRPSTEVLGVPRRLDDVIATGLAKDPSERYPTTRDFAEAARNALAGSSANQRTTPLGRPVSLPTDPVPLRDPRPSAADSPRPYVEPSTIPSVVLPPLPPPREVVPVQPRPPAPLKPEPPPVVHVSDEASAPPSGDIPVQRHWAAIAIWSAVVIVAVITIAVVVVALVGGPTTDADSATSSKRSLQVATSSSNSAGPTSTSTESDATRKLLGLLSTGYSADDCTPAELTANAIAVVDCPQNDVAGGPTGTRYFLFANAADLSKQFTTTIAGDATFPCERGVPATEDWHYDSTPTQTAGQASCGTLDGKPHLVWTDTAKLLMASAQGTDINAMFKWFLTYG